MGIEAVNNVIRSRWKTNIADAQSVTTVYDNAPDTHPDDSLWVRLSIKYSQATLNEIGSQKTFRIRGRMVAQIFDRIEKGDKDINALIDTIRPFFRAVTDTGVTFMTPEVSVVGADGKWWQVNLSCPFYTNELV